MPLAITWIINCPGPGSGTSRSRTEISFGLSMTTVFIPYLLNFAISHVSITINDGVGIEIRPYRKAPDLNREFLMDLHQIVTKGVPRLAGLKTKDPPSDGS
jgi:hypothetical protein